MAATTAGATLTEGHRIAQARLGARTVELMRSAWPLLDPSDLDATVERWLRVAVPIVQRQRGLSARLAAQYLQAFRSVEAGLGDFTGTLADSNDLARIVTSLTVTGPVSIKQQMRRAVPLVRAITMAEAASAGAGMRHALNGGRFTILRSVDADDQALGWARATSGKPCAFCAMLASRGPVYKGEDTAGFKPHDNCHCVPEPIYQADAAWPRGGERFRDMWREAKTLDGDTEANFRRLVEAA